MQNVPIALQVRNNGVVMYPDTSFLDFQRNGNKSSLKQNLDSDYKDSLSKLQKVEALTSTFPTIDDYANSYNFLYKLHSDKMLKENEITLKPLGTMSVSQVSSCKKVIENMISTVLLSRDKSISYKDQQYLTFVTLTLPSAQVHTDRTLRAVLIRFIENLVKTHQVVHYVWKAEPQKNGNIHFHLLIDRWIEQSLVQGLWNKQLSKLGYVDTYCSNMRKRGFIYKKYVFYKGKKVINPTSYKSQLDYWNLQDSLNFVNPPSTDIHSLKSVKNTSNYIIKYMTKLDTFIKDENGVKQLQSKRPIIGTIWGCANLSKRLTYPTFRDNELFFDEVNSAIMSKEIKQVVQEDYLSVYSGKIYKVLSQFYKTTWYAIVRHYKALSKMTKESYQNIQKLYENSISPKITVFTQTPKHVIPDDPQKSLYFPRYSNGVFT